MLRQSDIEDGIYRAVTQLGEQSRYGDATLALNPDGAGLSAGGSQYTQASGNLGKVLRRAYNAFPAEFAATFGPSYRELLKVTEAASLAPVGGVELWREPWVSRFKAAGKTAWFSAACRGHFFSTAAGFWPATKTVSGQLKATTERSLCIITDRAVNGGPGRAVRAASSALAHPGFSTLDEAGRVSIWGYYALAYVRGGKYESTMQERWVRVIGAGWLRDEPVDLSEVVG